jgi:FAD dependent oxidoreductase
MRLRDSFDVVVAGGGTAGAIAGIAAARSGARTLIVERYGQLGGVLSLGMTFHGVVDGEGYWVLGGVGRELIERLIPLGGATQPSVDPLFGSVSGQDPELLKLVLLQMAVEADVQLLLHAMVVDVTSHAGRVSGLVVATKHGIEVIPAAQFVDCTSDADLVARAGGQLTVGRESDHLTQPASRIFRVAGVDLDRMWGHLARHPEDHGLPEGWHGGDFDVEFLRDTPGASMEVFSGLITCARAAGDFHVPRDRISIDTMPGRREITVNVTRVHDVDGTDPDSLTRAEVQAQLQMLEVMRFLHDYVPGFEEAYIVSTPFQLGVRETRRIVGDYALTKVDVQSGRNFEDQVARGAYPLDVHDVRPGDTKHNATAWAGGVRLSRIWQSYGIPRRCLLPNGLANVAVGGRCISATHQAAGSTRGQTVCMATGHAAGTMAATAAIQSVDPADLPIDSVQHVLRSQGAILERTERLTSEDVAV